jgi:dTDP-4-dehydrorhamnose 3,5-epimerase
MAYNPKRGTLRGMHFQVPPHAEAKLVRCTRGEIFDVIIDLRPDSPTYKECYGIMLSAENYLSLYVPEGFAHGYQTVVNNSAISYLTTALYAPTAARGVRYNDPAFGPIEWPLPVSEISEADRKWQDYRA